MSSPIAQAMAHRLAIAQDAAEQRTRASIDAAYAELAAADWDLDKVAPLPDGNIGRAKYREMQAKHNFFLGITTWVKPTRRLNEPNSRKPAPTAVERRVSEAREKTAASFAAFVAKLEQKVGEHSAATLDCGTAWDSILTVTTPTGQQRWKTQMIINCSSLGKLFNQWPTRPMK